MKALFVLNQTPSADNQDGLVRWLFNVIRSMRQMVERLDIISQHDMTSRAITPLSQYGTRFLSVPVDSTKRHYFKVLRGWDHAKIRSFDEGVATLVRQWTEEIHYDLAIFFGHGTHCYLPYVKAAHRMIFPMDAPSGLAYSTPKSIVKRVKNAVNKYLLISSERSYNFADSVAVVSGDDARLLKRDGVRIPVVVMPLGVDTGYFDPECSDSEVNQHSVLFTGMLNFEPNIDAAIHFIRDIFVPEGLNTEGITCTIAGRHPCPEVERLSQIDGVRIIAERLGERLSLPPSLEPYRAQIEAGALDLRPIFRQSAVYVTPMRIGFGMKTKVLEAMSMSVPVVGYPRAFNGFLQPVEGAILCSTPSGIASSIRLLVADSKLRGELGAKARRYVQTYHSTDQIVAQILDYATSHRFDVYSHANTPKDL